MNEEYLIAILIDVRKRKVQQKLDLETSIKLIDDRIEQLKQQKREEQKNRPCRHKK